ncbi:SDR family NAD(P)-dependent oxidoreductase [Virgibacillus litoralis]|uniref:3-oxoacyl-[acyl-carrier protein] reductase n=1 Tax=Virgibacillus litoralis TaxID=578221 RepID=A0ABS4HDT8_9BACI|nr:glucose 1-dehydrogenase [Virgibacillus litoralis]MBP1949080.1 3-oxoacyl-[acyl-carrier protein] reductase [Virgibacillus litoralis]
MLLKNKVALITGAGSGMGKAQAVEYSNEGAKVILADINLEGAEKTAQQLRDNGGEAVAVKGNVAKKAEAEDMVNKGLEHFGHIDILSNTAGILDNYKPSLEIEEDEWDQIMGVNLKGAYLMTNAVLPQMIEKGKGTVINFASIAGFVAGGGGAVYTPTKHGIIGYTKQLSFDYGKKGIKANAICPGAVETAMTKEIFEENEAIQDLLSDTPAGRAAKPEEIAYLSVFLASDKSDFIHGAPIKIDGGWTVK